MKVFVVVPHDQYDGYSKPVFVADSREKADEYIKKRKHEEASDIANFKASVAHKIFSDPDRAMKEYKKIYDDVYNAEYLELCDFKVVELELH